MGDVAVAESVAPLGGEEGGVGFVEEGEGGAVVDVEGDLVSGVFYAEGGAWLQEHVEGVELFGEDVFVAGLGPGFDLGFVESLGEFRMIEEDGFGADLGPDPVCGRFRALPWRRE